MLVLFDIDGTLITSRRAGVEAMVSAGADLFGEFTDADVEYAGRLDPLIVRELLTRNGQAPTPENVTAFRAAYFSRLTDLLAEPGRSTALPGTLALVSALHDDAGVTLGLLTGNYAHSGRLKIEAAGFDADHFEVCVWGDDSPHEPPHRDHLPGVALERCRAGKRADLVPESVIVIGDTPHDIACARAHSCRVIAVATGKFSVAELADADLALPDLSETERLLEWIRQTIGA